MSKKPNRRQLERDHRRDPHCRMCQRLTVLRPQIDGGSKPLDTAVLARWFPKDDPRNALKPGKARRRLTCSACAQKRNRMFEAARPIEELRLAAGYYDDRRRGPPYYVVEAHP